MSVIRTDLWLLELYDNPIKICTKLTEYFKGISAVKIYDYLTLHGMYRQPAKNGITQIKRLQNQNIWKIIQTEEQQLQKEWNGPDVPIFILPSDSNDNKMRQEFNGKSGISFHDKIFLFISEHNDENELKALFTHEYNHVCRLSKYEKDVKDYVLLDSIILEGLAENAVRERSGEEFVSNWASYYSKERLEDIWKNIVLPNKNVSINNRKHHQILYGFEPYPNMAGYCVGYYLVKKYIEKHGWTCIDLIDQPSEKMVESIF